MTKIITVAAAKGGVGKTTLAYELAAALTGCLVDLDWDAGGATRMWGFDPAARQRSALLDAFEKGPDGRAPRPRRRPHQPDLVASHPDLSASRIDTDLVADCLVAWAPQLSPTVVVVDTHPGANPLTDGAVVAADLVVIPAVLGMREMTALEQNLTELSEHRILVVPTMVPTVPPRRLVDRLAAVAGGRVSVAPPISEHRWLRRRLRRAAVVSQPRPGVRVQAAAAEFRSVADVIRETLDG